MIFQKYKGFGVIDTIRKMDIDGTSAGVSGATLQQIKVNLPPEFTLENSVWIYFRGKQIHLRFLSFGNEDELRRIVLSLIRYGNKGSLTQNVGKVVATSWDKSRITALCPPASENWVVFVRKFGVSHRTPRDLIIRKLKIVVAGEERVQVKTKNGDMVLEFLLYIMRGMVTSAFTGQQGTGKTTLMNAIIEFIDKRETIRTLEMSFELYLKNVYPDRNILGVQETPSVSASTLQDTLKKTDASVSLVGEVATDEVAALMVQMAQVASKFTLFSHHAVTARDLILAVRNSVANARGISQMDTVERQIVEVVKLNVHLGKTPDGIRFIERITEIVPLAHQIPYPVFDGTPETYYANHIEYMKRVTDRTMFSTQDIITFDVRSETYNMVHPLSDSLLKYMLNSMSVEDGDKFKIATNKWWGETHPGKYGEEWWNTL
jgi:pilus assembly protein CpaF